MRAMVTAQFGGADLFEEREVDRPSLGAGEVLVRVVAAGTNPVDAKLRACPDRFLGALDGFLLKQVHR